MPQSIEALDKFVRELFRWNKTINLISKALTEKDFRALHLQDADRAGGEGSGGL
jgi:16S rRNA G527 N7-methylase RsmG